jgi:hypothetical protein
MSSASAEPDASECPVVSPGPKCLDKPIEVSTIANQRPALADGRIVAVEIGQQPQTRTGHAEPAA